MICEDLKPAAQIETIKLSERDVPEMLDLVALAQPGPFLPRTIELGDYYGIRRDGKLVAIAAERLHLAIDNHTAMRLYQKFGFRLRTEIQLFGIQRVDA